MPIKRSFLLCSFLIRMSDEQTCSYQCFVMKSNTIGLFPMSVLDDEMYQKAIGYSLI